MGSPLSLGLSALEWWSWTGWAGPLSRLSLSLLPPFPLALARSLSVPAPRFLQGQVRLSKKMLDPEKPQLGMIDRWYHPSCFVQRREELGFRPEYSAGQLKGFSLLTPEDKEALKKQLPAVKGEG